MGDLATHAEITGFVVEEARRTIPDDAIPEADYTFLELGNFLTDVSQFRDPPAFHRARDVARAQASSQSIFAGLAGADDWVRDVFGQSRGPRHGDLPEMMRLILQALTHEIFDTDGLSVLGAGLDLLDVDGRPPLIPTHGIEPADVATALGAHFTQYFPHEHLDFPPTAAPLTRHRTDPLFVRESRGLLGYLEWFIQYLSEGLTQLEDAWTRARATQMTDAQRRDFLIRLGHLLHPVEDYFFHSNLVERYQWQEVRERHPTADPAVPEDLRTLVEDGLTGTRLSPTSVSLRRKLHRRLRYPVWTSNTQLSTTTSDDATDLVYTGGFGQTDVWHTLGGALEAIERKIATLPPTHDPRTTPLVLIRLLLSEAERSAMVRDGTVEAMRTRHLEQLRAGDYPTAITTWEGSGLLCPHAGAELRAAFARDLATSTRHSGRFATFPGPGAVLITMLDQMQREREGSTSAARRLDSAAASMHEQRTENGCSEENIGTHSLMSKDSRTKEPLRPEAVALAKHASASIATTLLDRVHSITPVTEGIDWDTLVRFFIRGPVPIPETWEGELWYRSRTSSGFEQPHVTSVGQQPEFALLSPTFGGAKLAARRAGRTQADLEAYYRRFESDP
jgi:hypothetical protein